MLFHKKLITIIVLFISHVAYASHIQEAIIVQRFHVKLADQLAGYKALEKKLDPLVPLYFFHDQDLDKPQNQDLDALKDPLKTSTKKQPTTTSLYARYNKLPIGVQDCIFSYLVKTKWSDEKDPQTDVLKVIEDEVWKNDRKKEFDAKLAFCEKKSEYAEFVQGCLRTEYWLRFVKRARNESIMINKRMAPSTFVKPSSWFCDPLQQICDQEYFREGVEIAALMIHCGVLVHQEKSKKRARVNELSGAVPRDNLALVRLLMHAGLTQCDYQSTGETPMHVAASCNALQVIRYLYNKGYDLDAQNNVCRYTPLRRAYWREHHEAVSLLIELGARTDIKDCEGKKYNEAGTASLFLSSMRLGRWSNF